MKCGKYRVILVFLSREDEAKMLQSNSFKEFLIFSNSCQYHHFFNKEVKIHI